MPFGVAPHLVRHHSDAGPRPVGTVIEDYFINSPRARI